MELTPCPRWKADFSADVTGKTIKDETADYAQNLAEIKTYFAQHK